MSDIQEKKKNLQEISSHYLMQEKMSLIAISCRKLRSQSIYTIDLI